MIHFGKVEARLGKILMCIFLSALLLCSCSDSSQKAGTRTIKKDNLTALIMKDGRLIPGDDLEWHMSEDGFLSSGYGSEELDPDSEKFEDFRVSTMTNGWTCYRPLAEVKLKGYDVTAEPEYIFDANDGLLAIVYSIRLPEDSAEVYQDILNRFCVEADQADMLSAQDEDMRDITAEDVLNTIFVLQWENETDPMYFEIDSAHFGDALFMSLRVSVIDTRADEYYP